MVTLMAAIKDKNDNIIRDRRKIVECSEEFYMELCKCKDAKVNSNNRRNQNADMAADENSDKCDIPDVLFEEVTYVIRNTKTGKASGTDQIISEILYYRGTANAD